MVYHRKGQDKWIEWEGEGYEPADPDRLVYYTTGYVDGENESQTALVAGALRNSGVADGWSDAFKMAENLIWVHGYVAETDDGDRIYWAEHEDEPVEGLLYESATFVEVSVE